MKKSVLALLTNTLMFAAIFLAAFLVFLSIIFSPTAAMAQEGGMRDPTNDPWDSVMSIRVVEDEWGCQKQSGLSTQYMEVVERRVCPQTFDSFYARMSAAQKQKALEEGKKFLTKSFGVKYPDLLEEAALNEFFLAHTGANPS